MTFGSDDRGVSDTVGFVFIFALIIGSTGVVYTVGYSGLQDARNFEQMNNAERAFEVLGENIEDLRRHSAPSRSTEIKLGGATIRVGEPITVNVTADYESGQTDPEYDLNPGPIEIAPIVYESDQGSLLYVNGAIIRSERGGGLMVHDPEMVLDNQQTLIPIMATQSRDGGVGGHTTAHVRTERRYTDVLHSESRGTYDEVTVRMTTPRADLWEDYFEGEGMSCTQPSTNTIDCTLTEVEQLHVVIVRITVSIA